MFPSVTARGLYCHCILFVLTTLQPLFLKEKGLPYAYGQALESARPSASPSTDWWRVNHLLA